ncbi:hypothetical protein GF314_16450 [bacterium]|nr:hypothetical protein [bacterium]
MASKKLITALVGLSIMALVVGCGSDDDSPTAPVTDTAPPALPGNLAVDYAAAQDQATITWDANVTDADLAGYLVARASYDGDPLSLTDAPQAANSYQDDLGDCCGRLLTYYVHSVDTSGNVSAAATVTLQMPSPEPGRDADRNAY